MSLPLGPVKKSRPVKEPPIIMPARAQGRTGLTDLMILRSSLDNVGEIKTKDEPADVAWSWMTFWSYTGPGFLIAIAYLDPGNLEADLQAGAYTKYQLTWVFFITTIIGLFLQAMGARIGIVTGKHLAELCREEYSRPRSIGLWIMSEIAIIASDIQAVVCSAIALKILFNLPLWQGCIITVIDTFTFLFLHVFGIRSLEFFFVFLVGVMAVCFFWNFTLNPPEAQEVFGGMLPTIPSAVVLSRDIDRTNPVKHWLSVSHSLSIWLWWAASPNSSTVSACLDMDSVKEHHDMYGNCTLSGQSGQCQQIGLRDADIALETVLGGTASLIWALGLLASGQSSTMTITYAGQFITEGFGGFMLPVHYRVLFCRSISIIPALIAALMESSYPTIMDELTQWGNIVTSCCVPFAVLPMLRFCSSEKIMGEHVMNIQISRGMWMVSWGLILVNLMVIWETILTFQPVLTPTITIVIIILVSILYLFFSYMMVEDEIKEGIYFMLQCCRSVVKTGYHKDESLLGNFSRCVNDSSADDIDHTDHSHTHILSSCSNVDRVASAILHSAPNTRQCMPNNKSNDSLELTDVTFAVNGHADDFPDLNGSMLSTTPLNPGLWLTGSLVLTESSPEILY
eukprot:gene4519-8976_t